MNFENSNSCLGELDSTRSLSSAFEALGHTAGIDVTMWMVLPPRILTISWAAARAPMTLLPASSPSLSIMPRMLRTAGSASGAHHEVGSRQDVEVGGVISDEEGASRAVPAASSPSAGSRRRRCRRMPWPPPGDALRCRPRRSVEVMRGISSTGLPTQKASNPRSSGR